ncbi:MAG: hypothetical protein ACYCRD_04630 [Leptospirillum sp.]
MNRALVLVTVVVVQFWLPLSSSLWGRFLWGVGTYLAGWAALWLLEGAALLGFTVLWLAWCWIHGIKEEQT